MSQTEDDIFNRLVQEWIKPSGIPSFYKKKVDQEPSELFRLLQEATFQQTLDRKRGELPTNDELDLLWEVLTEHTHGLADEDKARIKSMSLLQRMSFADFKRIEKLLPSKFSIYFKPSKFFRFTHDGQRRISILHFYNYVLRKVSLVQARADLGCYDDNYDGFITEEDLHRYVNDLMPLLNLQNMTPSFVKFYICTAVRKFMFFLDPYRRGKIPIHSILLSPILTELFELREPEPPHNFERTNWFSSYSALRIYGQYLNLDVDHNGMLSRQELSKYNNSSITDLILDRVFQECQTYGKEMDYKGFLNFVLAMENPHTPEALMYFFKLLDISHVGYLDEFTIKYFAQSVIKKMIYSGYDEIGLQDITNEIFDMAHPSHPLRITLQDLIKCGVGGTILTILSDVRGFWAYENREQLDPAPEEN